MAREQLGTVLQFIRRTVSARDASTDADLLERFATQREEAAFTALLQRHGPMVLSVCRRVLDNAADADDALQATFLVLVHRADSIRKSASVASWLHGVALRVALEARTRAARRRAHEQRAGVVEQAESPGAEATRELRAILDEELEQLPAKYRSPLVLHYFEGKTKDETARQLGWSEGTVSGRLARARELLRHRLGRRGLLLSGGMLAAALAQEGAALAVSAVLTESTLKTATLFAAGEAAVGASAARIAALTERVMQTMFLTKLKIATAVLLLLVPVGLGAGGLFYQAQADPPGDRPQPQPAIANTAGALKDQPAQVKKPGAIFKAPGSYTLDVALSPDGKLLARAGTGETVDLWDVASGKKLHTLKGHTAPLFKVAFSPDGKTLASITGTWLPDDVRGEVKLWDVATGKERVALKGHPGRGVALAFSPDGKTLATCGKTTVKLWDAETGKEKMELSAEALSLAFSPDGQTLATATYSVILWDVTTGKKRATLPRLKTFGISCVRFAPDGKTLASVSGFPSVDEVKPGALTLWDVATAKERATLPIRMATPLQDLDLAFTADGKTMISAIWSFGETQKEGGLVVQHWELATGKAGAAFWAPVDFSGPGGAGSNAGVFFAALSADGKTVAWGGAEGKGDNFTGTAHVWEVGSLATSAPKLPKDAKKIDAEGAKKADEGKKPRMITMGVIVLISAKTEGISEGAKIKQIDAPKESIGKRGISNAHVTKGRASGREGADQPRLNGTWVVKKCTVTLADGKTLENREVLFGIDFPPQALKRLRFVETVQAESDQGVGAWYAYDAADMQLPGPEDPVPDVAKKNADAWTPLFNGKDLKGWSVEGDNPEAWRVEGDELLVDAAKGGRRYNWLLSEKTYSEFLLRFEYQLSEKATSGVAVWATRYEKVHPEGPNHLQVKLMDDPNYPNIRWPTGAIFWNVDGGSHIGPDRNAKLEPVGSWNRMEIEARAKALRISVNGVEVHNVGPDKLAEEFGAYAGLKRRTGHVGFGKGVEVARFRKIEIKELKPAAEPQDKKPKANVKEPAKQEVKEPAPKQSADGWVALFNQKDLTGWKTHPMAPGDWRVEDGILIGRGPKVSHLYTERGDYEDFDFRIEAKINARGNSGQSFRKQFSAKIGGDGYEAQIDSSSHKAKTGSLYIHTSPAVAIEQVLVPVDTWFTQEVIVRGNHIVILVNGQKTVDFIDKNNNYARGHLALQVYDPVTVVQFRQIEIKELKPATESQENNPKTNLTEPASKATTKAGGTEVKESKPDWAQLFGGKDLAGFEGLPGAWRLEAGVLLATRPAAPTTHATFLTSQKQFRDFELKFQVKLEGGQGGSGVILRGKPGARFLPTGPLVKIGEGWGGWGHLTTEQNGTPLIKMSKDMQEAVSNVVKKDGFNDYYIKCVGKQILIQVNGFTTVDQTWDPLPDEGILAFQIHFGRDTKAVAFRDVQIKELQAVTVPLKGYLGLVSVRPALHGEPYIDDIAAGSPAEKAGLKRGDTIVGLNDAKIHDIKQLGAAFDNLRLKPGERITVRILSADGKERSVTLTATERPKSDERKTLPTESKIDPKLILDETKELAGAWSVVSLKDNGNDMPADAVKDLRVIITGDKYVAKLEGKDTLAWTYKLDPTKKPKTLDITFLTARKQGQTAPGIYSLEGDTFTICGAEPGQARPTEFAAKPGSKHLLMVHKRETAKTPAVGDAKGDGPPPERKQPELNKPIRR